MYTPHTEADIAAMLKTIGAGSLDELLRVPDAVALKDRLDVVPALPEYGIAKRFEHFAGKTPQPAFARSWGAARTVITHRRRLRRLPCAVSF